MGLACVTRRIDAPAAKVWTYLSWFGVKNLANSSLFKGVDYEGDKGVVGDIRVLHLHDSLPVRERLEYVNEVDRINVYRVIDSGSMPVLDYEGRIIVTPCGPDACYVKISSSYTAVLMSDEEWKSLWETMEAKLLDDLAERVAAA